MQCLKCGKDVSSSPAFCDACLAERERYPVKPGTAIQLPKREAPARLTPLREASAADRLSQARKIIRWLYLTVALLALLLSITGIMLIRTLDRAAQPKEPVKGQDYTTSQQP